MKTTSLLAKDIVHNKTGSVSKKILDGTTKILERSSEQEPGEAAVIFKVSGWPSWVAKISQFSKLHFIAPDRIHPFGGSSLMGLWVRYRSSHR